MKILIVEDNIKELKTLEQELKQISKSIQIESAQSKASAQIQIQEKEFDLIILDLKIPTIDKALDPDRVHGMSVFSFINDYEYNCPIIIFSAFADFELSTKETLGYHRKFTFYSDTKLDDLCFIVKKDDLINLINYVGELSKIFNELDQITISTGGKSIDLKNFEKRILQIFSKRKSCDNIKIERLSGLSSSKTLKATFYKNGNKRSYGIIKINSIQKINSEKDTLKIM